MSRTAELFDIHIYKARNITLRVHLCYRMFSNKQKVVTSQTLENILAYKLNINLLQHVFVNSALFRRIYAYDAAQVLLLGSRTHDSQLHKQEKMKNIYKIYFSENVYKSIRKMFPYTLKILKCSEFSLMRLLLKPGPRSRNQAHF